MKNASDEATDQQLFYTGIPKGRDAPGETVGWDNFDNNKLFTRDFSQA